MKKLRLLTLLSIILSVFAAAALAEDLRPIPPNEGFKVCESKTIVLLTTVDRDLKATADGNAFEKSASGKQAGKYLVFNHSHHAPVGGQALTWISYSRGFWPYDRLVIDFEATHLVHKFGTKLPPDYKDAIIISNGKGGGNALSIVQPDSVCDADLANK